MDLKSIIAKHVEPVAVRHGTTWDDILEELMVPPQGGFYTGPTKRALWEIYNMSVLTGPEVLKQIYRLKRVPTREDVGVIPVRPKKYGTQRYGG